LQSVLDAPEGKKEFSPPLPLLTTGSFFWFRHKFDRGTDSIHPSLKDIRKIARTNESIRLTVALLTPVAFFFAFRLSISSLIGCLNVAMALGENRGRDHKCQFGFCHGISLSLVGRFPKKHF
jgi:hypothetical protein